MLQHKDTWDWCALLSNFAVFGFKKGKRIMKFKFLDGKTGKKTIQENGNKGRKNKKILNCFYKFLIIKYDALCTTLWYNGNASQLVVINAAKYLDNTLQKAFHGSIAIFNYIWS